MCGEEQVQAKVALTAVVLCTTASWDIEPAPQVPLDAILKPQETGKIQWMSFLMAIASLHAPDTTT